MFEHHLPSDEAQVALDLDDARQLRLALDEERNLLLDDGPTEWADLWFFKHQAT